jgi:hypothetical protein
MSIQFNAHKKQKSHSSPGTKVHFIIPRQPEETIQNNSTPIRKLMPQEATPHQTKRSTLLRRMEEGMDANISSVYDIGDGNPYNKGSLLTYYCTECNLRHIFHEGDIIKRDSPLQSGLSTNAKETKNPPEEHSDNSKTRISSGDQVVCGEGIASGETTSPEQPKLSYNSSSSDDSLPDIDVTQGSTLCCAEEYCVRSSSRICVLVTCYDCKGFFHENECGETIQLRKSPGQKEKTRYICLKCYNLCCSGRDVCKHPGETDGRIPCMTCYKKFHENGCGGGITRMRMSWSSNIVVDCLMCHACCVTRGKGHSFESLRDENTKPQWKKK